MTIRPESPKVITLPSSPNRRSVADLINVWESRAGVGTPKSRPVVETGISTMSFAPEGQSPKARDNSLFVGPGPIRTVAPLPSSTSLATRPMSPSLGLPKPNANDNMMLAVAPSAMPASQPTFGPVVTPAPMSVNPAANTGPVSPTTPTAPSSAVETSQPLQGGAGLVNAVSGQDGLKGALASASEGKTATALSNVVRNAVTAPFQTVSAILDGPRKIGDVASTKGRELVTKGDAQGGLTGALKVVGGSLAQVLGGFARLAQPLVGMALMAAAGPVGWLIGAILLGLFVLKEAGMIINNKVDEMQTVKALRDVASGVGALAGLVLEPIARPLMTFVKGKKAE